RKTVEPLEPCCRRFSAPFVEKMFRKRSKSSTCVVARIMLFLLCGSRRPDGDDRAASLRPWTRRGNGANALCAADEVVLERPERRGCAAANAWRLVEVLNLVSD